ncbi:hypothetical protein BGZ81_001775 [Podila clonocystis]|nr:hypothetical protein BGZ81_001775 [Podila clonocystis]
MGASTTNKANKPSSPPPSQVPQIDLTGEGNSTHQAQRQAPTGLILQDRPQRVFAAAEDGAYMHAIYMVRNIQSLIQNEQRLQIKMTSQHDLQCSRDAVTKLLHDAQKWVAVLDLLESRELVARRLAHPIV